MELYAAGFNAHRQLLSSPLNTPPQDLHSFQKIASGASIRVRCAVWSTTCLEIDGQLHLRGFHDSGVTDGIIAGPAAHEMRTVFGDTSGMLGALSTAGEIWTLASSELRFLRREVPVEGWAAREGLVIDDIAIADNDQVCLSTRLSHPLRTPAPLPTILTFPSFSTLLTATAPASVHSLPTPLTTLLAAATSFTALAASSSPLTWGDPRHLHLGRAPTPVSPASAPAPVLALDGIPVAKVVARGWLAAALSRERDVYLWGGRLGARERDIGVEPAASVEHAASVEQIPPTEQPSLVEPAIPAPQPRPISPPGDNDDVRLLHTPGGVDVADVAVGDGWVVILTVCGQVWGRGEGAYGQLGAGRCGWEGGWVEGVVEGWEGGGEGEGKVEGEGEGEGGEGKRGRRIVGVQGGVWNCFVLVSS